MVAPFSYLRLLSKYVLDREISIFKDSNIYAVQKVNCHVAVLQSFCSMWVCQMSMMVASLAYVPRNRLFWTTKINDGYHAFCWIKKDRKRPFFPAALWSNKDWHISNFQIIQEVTSCGTLTHVDTIPSLPHKSGLSNTDLANYYMLINDTNCIPRCRFKLWQSSISTYIPIPA